MASTGGIARTRYGLAKGFRGILGQGTMLEPLVVTHLDTYQIEHTVLHSHFHTLPMPSLRTLIERRQNSRYHMDTRTCVANLRARTERRTVFQTSRAHRPPHRLRNGLVGFEIAVRTKQAKPFNGRINDAGINLLDSLPGEPQAVQYARAKILDQHVRGFEQLGKNLRAV